MCPQDLTWRLPIIHSIIMEFIYSFPNYLFERQTDKFLSTGLLPKCQGQGGNHWKVSIFSSSLPMCISVAFTGANREARKNLDRQALLKFFPAVCHISSCSFCPITILHDSAVFIKSKHKVGIFLWVSDLKSHAT